MVKSQKTTFLCFCAFAFLFILAVVLSAYSVCQNVHDNGSGADAIRNELTDAEKSQSRAAESLDRAGELVESAAERNREIADGNQSLQGSERRDEEILRESEQILERVRARAKE